MKRLLIVGAVLVSACSGSASTDMDSGLAGGACVSMLRLDRDIQSGVAKDAEILSRLRTVHDQSQPWRTSKVHQASIEAIAGFNRGNSTAGLEGMKHLMQACHLWQ